MEKVTGHIYFFIHEQAV